MNIASFGSEEQWSRWRPCWHIFLEFLPCAFHPTESFSNLITATVWSTRGAVSGKTSHHPPTPVKFTLPGREVLDMDQAMDVVMLVNITWEKVLSLFMLLDVHACLPSRLSQLQWTVCCLHSAHASCKCSLQFSLLNLGSGRLSHSG